MHDSLTPLGGLVPLLHMMLNCVFGGKGVGLMNMVVYVILAVFICGLMVGRTPEYLNKKIEGKEMKLVAIVILIHPLLVLGFSALAVLSVTGGMDGICRIRDSMDLRRCCMNMLLRRQTMVQDSKVWLTTAHSGM